MRKVLVVLAVMMFFVGASWSNASAIPTINGTVALNEWDGFIIHSSDGNEGNIPDNWDISELYIIQVNTGGASDGLYFRIDVHGTATDAGENGDPLLEAYTYTFFDYDNDSVNDDLIEVNKLGAGLIRVNGVAAAGGLYGVGPDAWEFFVPESDLSPKALPSLTNSLRGFTHLDGSGDSADDRTPNTGRYTIIPEPGSMALLGMGLFGMIGAGFRRRKR